MNTTNSCPSINLSDSKLTDLNAFHASLSGRCLLSGQAKLNTVDKGVIDVEDDVGSLGQTLKDEVSRCHGPIDGDGLEASKAEVLGRKTKL